MHVFTPAARDYYRLETLWGEVPELEVEYRRYDLAFDSGASLGVQCSARPEISDGLR